MKKKNFGGIAVICAAILACGTLAGCETKTGGDNPSTTGTEVTGTGVQDPASTAEPLKVTEGRTYAKDMDLDKYVTLKDYQNFRVERDPVEIDEEEVELILKDAYYNYFPADQGIKDRAVADGDTVNIAYVGKKDGVAFDGGTAESTPLTIGSNSYIDGFESGLIGVMPGETVDLNLTFPEDYHSEELAGQAVVFTVTVNCIIPEEMKDEHVAGIVPDIDTVEGLRQYIRDYLTEAYQSEGDDAYQEKVLETFMEEMCEVKEVPQEWIDYYREQINNYFVTMAFQMATDPDTLVQTYFGQDLESFLNEHSVIAAREDLVLQALAKKQGLCIDDEELNRVLQEQTTNAGLSSIADYLGESSMEDFRQTYHYQLAVDYLYNLASQK